MTDTLLDAARDFIADFRTWRPGRDTDRIVRALVERVQQAEAERDQLGNAAFAAYCAAGGDTDTARNWQEFFRPITLPAWSEVVEREVRQAIRDEEEEAETQAGIAAIRTAERDSWHQAALTATAGESRAERERDEARGKLDKVREAVTAELECLLHDKDDPVQCGWKRTVRDVLAILDGKTGD